jgi:hypothetical protein
MFGREGMRHPEFLRYFKMNRAGKDSGNKASAPIRPLSRPRQYAGCPRAAGLCQA